MSDFEPEAPHNTPCNSPYNSPYNSPCNSRRAFLRDVADASATVIGLASFLPVSMLQALSITPDGLIRYPIPASDGVHIDSRQQVILRRFKGEIFAFALACPHQNTALRALPGERGFQCPRHKSRYQPDGTFIDGKATRNMDRLPIHREGADVVVDPDVAYQSDRDPVPWRDAVVRVS